MEEEKQLPSALSYTRNAAPWRDTGNFTDNIKISILILKENAAKFQDVAAGHSLRVIRVGGEININYDEDNIVSAKFEDRAVVRVSDVRHPIIARNYNLIFTVTTYDVSSLMSTPKLHATTNNNILCLDNENEA